MPLIATKGAASAQGFGEFAQSGPVNYIEDVFSTYLYTGNGSTQTITNNIDLSTKGGLVWCKFRNDSVQHALYDTVRGVQKELNSAGTGAEITRTNGLTSFSSTGFVLGSDSVVNQGSAPNNYVSWTFREQPKFFDIVTYTGNGSGSRNISHNLGSAPGCIIIKCTSTTSNWMVWHRSISGQDNLYLNSTAGTSGVASDPISVPGFPSSLSTTEFNVSTGTDSCNTNGETYVAYLFAHNAGGFGLTGSDNVISCGSYSGTGTTNFISLGWEPQWVLVKRTDSTGDWYLLDNMRGWVTDSNVNAVLLANTSGDEGQSASGGWPAATGFYAGSGAYTSSTNTNGGTYIYIAIRRGPMKTPTSGTSVFTPVAYSGTGATRTITGVGFPLDANIVMRREAHTYNLFSTRLQGLSADGSSVATPSLASNTTDAEFTTFVNSINATSSSAMDGYTLYNAYTQMNASGGTYVSYNLRRAPGFFDVVCYTGNSVAGRTINHNLTVVPELMIVKNRTLTFGGGRDWNVYAAPLGNVNAGLYLNLSNAASGSGGAWNGTVPTSSVFTVSANADVNYSSWTYVAYLFATVAGVSKVGSYTGTGTTLQVNCGFTGGARFVLIKRTDSTGDWYVWDSARGIVAGNDPYLLLNSIAAEVTNTDYVDSYSAGFEISSTAPAEINDNGGTYIFLAIA